MSHHSMKHFSFRPMGVCKFADDTFIPVFVDTGEAASTIHGYFAT